MIQTDMRTGSSIWAVIQLLMGGEIEAQHAHGQYWEHIEKLVDSLELEPPANDNATSHEIREYARTVFADEQSLEQLLVAVLCGSSHSGAYLHTCLRFLAVDLFCNRAEQEFRARKDKRCSAEGTPNSEAAS